MRRNNVAKYEKYAIVIKSPKSLELNQVIEVDGKDMLIKSIHKIEFISSQLALVTGTAKLI